MIITQEKIEQWEQDPKRHDYDVGYHRASNDVWNCDMPMVFTDKHSKAFREGYREGWADQKAYMRAETIDCSLTISERKFNELKKNELDYVTAKTNELAECPDLNVPEYIEDDWAKVIYLLLHPEEMKPIKRVSNINGVVTKEGYDNE